MTGIVVLNKSKLDEGICTMIEDICTMIVKCIPRDKDSVWLKMGLLRFLLSMCVVVCDVETPIIRKHLSVHHKQVCAA